MKNAQSIRILTRQICRTCERIESLTDGICEADLSGSGSAGVYKDIMLNELENAQMLTLKLTEMVSEVASESQSNEDGDCGSTFFSGELNHEEGDKEDGEDDDDDPDIGNPPSGPPFSVGVIVVSDGKVLVGTRLSDAGRGLLCGPGGYGMEGETPEDAARRETQEEFCITPVELIPIGEGKEGEDGFAPHLFICTSFSGEPECSSDEMGNASFLSLESLPKLSKHLYQPFADGITSMLSALGTDNKDGSEGSGNWGHEGRPGKLGGSASGGGTHNRMGDKKQGFTSFSKQKKKWAKPHKITLEELQKCPDGTIITGVKGTFKKHVKKEFDYSSGKEVEVGYFVNEDAGTKIPIEKMAKNVSKKEYGLAVPDSANNNYRKFKVRDDERFSETRRAAAFTTDNPKEADDLFRTKSGEIWSGLDDESRDALNSYTGSGYISINKGLRTGDLDSYTANKVNRITDAISQSKLEKDTWLYRGVDYQAAEKMLGLEDGTISSMDLGTLTGRTCHDDAFMSCGTAKSTGFTDELVSFTIYCPEGTEALYAEPFSQYGGGDGRRWDSVRSDGKSSQGFFSDEFETILQRGTEMQVIEAKNDGGRISITAQVISQNYKPVG